jgi:hypothetical protein
MRSKIRTPPSLESSINFDVISVVIIWCRLRHRLREPASIDGQVGKYWQVLILHVNLNQWLENVGELGVAVYMY